jgi:hypothetical protein
VALSITAPRLGDGEGLMRSANVCARYQPA